MDTKRYSALIFAFIFLISGCGYTTKVTLPYNVKTVAVPMFTNSINPDDLYAYLPGLESMITNTVIDQILFDSSMLEVADEDKADAILIGDVIQYEKEPLRYDDSDIYVDEYRVFIVVNLKLKDRRTDEIIWEESGFTGQSSYFLGGVYATTENEAAKKAVNDLARLIVDRMVEDW